MRIERPHRAGIELERYMRFMVYQALPIKENVMTGNSGKPGQSGNEEQRLREEELADRAARETIVSETIPGMDDPIVREGDPSGRRKGGKSTADEDTN
ncbi:MAG: hypothetical protein JWP36_972 [Paucimonas sp.]|nr:hypothetical protein [Paucimonas sp.]